MRILQDPRQFQKDGHEGGEVASGGDIFTSMKASVRGY